MEHYISEDVINPKFKRNRFVQGGKNSLDNFTAL